MKINILNFESIDSTNTEAVKQARKGAHEGLCITARQQTAGRGRQGRKWISPPDSGLYFSIVLRPQLETRHLPLITLMTGVAVCDALAVFGIKADIKWVNDLLVDDKKIGGILAEAVETAGGTAVIVGIGINLLSDSFPPEIAEIATSIEAVTGERVTRDDLAYALTSEMKKYYSILQEGGYAAIIENWSRRSTYFRGKEVRAVTAEGVFEGVTDGLEENGALRVKMADGGLRIIQAGDVHQLRQRNIEL